MKYSCHIVESTHWDREWVKSFQQNRILLLEMLDTLFEVFEKYPEYKYFHLDSQTIPLEDFAEVCPEKVPQLKKYIADGRLLVGPWYTLPDMNTLDGECIIRNLLFGHRLAKEYGGVMKVGYTPTSDGQISQLPQIYRGFGIDAAIFYRGINDEKAPREYIWKSPDGSEVLGIRPPQKLSRCTFWGYLVLPVLLNYYDHIEESKKQTWNQGGAPFKLAEPTENTYVELDPLYYYNKEAIDDGLRRLMDEITRQGTCNVLLAMNGHDQSFPILHSLDIIKDVNKHSDEVEMKYSSFPAYIEDIRTAIKGRQDNVVIEGEMREINKSGPFMASHLFPAVISTKQRLKMLNCNIENNLIRLLEPLQAMAYMSGARYPERLINLAWRYLLTNHSHDAINGCSLDKVYSDMLHRFSEAEEIIKSLVPLAISAMVEKIDTSAQPQGSVILTVLNPALRQRSQLVKLAVDFDPSVQFESIGLSSRSGTLIPFQQEAVYDHGCGIDKKYHHLGFPVKRFEGYAWIENIPAMGYITLVATGSAAPGKEGCIISGNNCLENEYLKVRINENGTFSILHKETGHEFINQHYFEDRGEAGNAWEGNVPEVDRVLTSLECMADTKIVVNGPLIGIIEIKIRMDLPVSCTDDYKRRSKEMRQVEIVSRISLAFNSRRLEIETSLENTVRDHRLRIMFDSHIQAPNYYARMPFDVVQRPVHKKIDPAWRERTETTGPAQGFAGISEGKTGLAVLSQGIYEIEITDTPERTIALTLLRSFYQHGNWDKKRWNEEGFQNPGRFTFQYAVYPHKGNWEEGDVFQQYEDMNTPVKAAQHGVKKGTAPWRNSLISIDNPFIQLAAVKKHEHGDGIILRLFNPGSSEQRGVLRASRKIKFSAYTDMEEQLISSSLPEDHSVDLEIPHHRVINLLLKFN